MADATLCRRRRWRLFVARRLQQPFLDRCRRVFYRLSNLESGFSGGSIEVEIWNSYLGLHPPLELLGKWRRHDAPRDTKVRDRYPENTRWAVRLTDGVSAPSGVSAAEKA